MKLPGMGVEKPIKGTDTNREQTDFRYFFKDSLILRPFAKEKIAKVRSFNTAGNAVKIIRR